MPIRGYVDDSEATIYCSSAFDYEEACTEIASKYAAALTIFNFLWAAYEAAVRVTLPDYFRGLSKEGRLGERGRRLLDEKAIVFPQIFGVSNVARLSEYLCGKGELFDGRMKKILSKFAGHDMVFSAELVREFRNFVVHGEDEVPAHEGWNFGVAGASTARIRRFYANSRLLLFLIQSFAAAGVSERNTPIQWGTDDRLDYLTDYPKKVLTNLHLITP